jgi:hypothetical protein
MNQALRNTRDDDRLDQIIESYSASAGGPSYESMLAWISRYPEYEREIIDFTVDWFMAEQTAPALGEADEELTAETLQRHREIIQEIVSRHIATQVGIEGLLAEAKARGMSRKQLADAVRLTIPLIDKLDRRLIHYSSIPRAIIESLAQALSRQVDTVSQYLQGTPLLPAGASYKAEEAPSLPEVQDFSDAVQDDRTLSPERKRELMRLVGDQSK